MIRLFDTSVQIERRLFKILAITASVANTVGFISNTIFYGLTWDTIFYGVCAVIMMTLGLIGCCLEQEHWTAPVVLVIVDLVEFPLMYYLYGSGRAVYMVLGLIGVLVFIHRKYRIFWAVITLFYDIAIMVLGALHPYDGIEVTPESDLGATVVSFVIVGTSIIMLLILIVMQYEVQNTKLRVLTDELEDMANKDPLTHLYNRRYLTNYLEPLMASRSTEFAVALLDIDNFKKVNDTYGHIYGDEVLQDFAACMMQEVAEAGIAARFGGEEFMLVIHSINEAEIEEILGRIREKFEKITMEKKGKKETFSGGVEFFKNVDRITQLFNAADEKLYYAKMNGKNRVIFQMEQSQNELTNEK